MISSYFFAYKPLSQRLLALPYIFCFLEMKSWSLYGFWIVSQPDHAPQVFISSFH
jgi:hypothetical protein